MRPVGKIRAVLLAATVALGGLAAGTSSAAADDTPQVGNDISWPQCPAPDGYGNPMPTTDTGFVIVGTTRGLAFTENPCLTAQANWIRSNYRPFHAYSMANYPTNAQYKQYGVTGPFVTSTVIGKFRNVGFAEAEQSIATLKKVGLKPVRIWIDVEARSTQPWPRGDAYPVAAERNRAILDGMLYSYKRAGIPAGFYSNSAGWREITAGWQRPDIPFWGTVGTRGQDQATAGCATPGLNGGPVYLMQWWDTTPMDYDVTCPAGGKLGSPKLTLSWPTRSSAKSRLGRTDVILTAGPSRRQVWSLTVKNACTGSTVRTITGVSADKIVVHWNGRRDNGALAPASTYRLVLRTGTRLPANGVSYEPLHQVLTAAGKASGCKRRV